MALSEQRTDATLQQLRRIDEARHALGVKRSKLCAYAGISASVMSHALAGRRNGVSDTSIQKLLTALERIRGEQRAIALRLEDLTNDERSVA